MTSLSSQFDKFVSRGHVSKHTNSKNYYKLKDFITEHGHLTADEITTDMIMTFINQRNQGKTSPATKAMIRSCAHALLAFCDCDPNPADALPRWRETPGHIVIPDETAVKRALDEAVSMCGLGEAPLVRDGLIFALSVVSGNRRGELRNLQAKEIVTALGNPINGVYRVYTDGKTGEAITRFTGFHVPLINAYLDVRPETECKYLFVNKDGGHLSLVGFNRARPKVCERAGVPTITYQELRRRLATIIANTEGVDVAANALNHSPHSGDRVIRAYYWDPDKAKVDKATAAAFKGMG